jgi:hypothetical protein
MSDTLTQLVTKLQALLLGDSTTFSTATCTAAIRQAFKQLNFTVPCHVATTVDAVSEQYEYELDDQTAINIVDVLLEGTDTYHDFNVSLKFDKYFEDDRPYFRLRVPQSTGSTLIVRYTKSYTINGLDGETVSTMPALYDVVLLDGAAWIACLVRATGLVETINMNQGVTANFEKMSDHFRQAFEAGLIELGKRQAPRSACPGAAGTGEPVMHGWDDSWKGEY